MAKVLGSLILLQGNGLVGKEQISYFDRRVLVVDDDPNFRTLMARVFRQWGYTVELCCSGEEALSLLQDQDAPRFVLIDWLMPGADGAEVCRHIKRAHKNRFTYVMIVTGEDQETAAQIAFETDADDFLSKPVNIGVLQTRIRSAVKLIEYELNQERQKQILQERILVLEKLAYGKVDNVKQESNLVLAGAQKSEKCFSVTQTYEPTRTGHPNDDGVSTTSAEGEN